MRDSRIFIDTAPFIYILEDNPLFSDKTRTKVSSWYNDGALFYTSLFTFSEYCVVPYRLNDTQKINDFEMFLDDAEIFITHFTKEIAMLSANLRAKYSAIKSMDALQLASAIQNNCDVFFTNDRQLKQVAEINCVLVDEL